MQKMAATGMEITTRRHTGQTADIMIVKGDRTLLKPVEIWCFYSCGTVGLHRVSVQRIQQYKDDFHFGKLSLNILKWRPRVEKRVAIL
jgi:hypothetical protein